MAGFQTITDIRQPKTRNSTALAGFQIVAVANHPNTHTTEVGWAIYRINTTTGDIDWAKDANGNSTDDYVFTGVNIHTHTFNE